MGYDTRFTGHLKFDSDVTVPMLASLKAMLGEDCRKHPEWQVYDQSNHGLTYVDLVLLDDFSGVEFDDDTEKSDLGPEMIDLVTAVMREKHPESGFAFRGELLAQGEDPYDRWRLVVDGDQGKARRVEYPRIGQKVTCPHCKGEFTLEGDGGS